MSYFTECVIGGIKNLGTASKTLNVDPVADFSIKLGDKQHVVWVEGCGPSPAAVPPTIMSSPSELTTTLDDVVIVQLKGKRVRLHSDNPSGKVVSSIDLI